MHNIHRFNCINMLDRMRTLYLHCLSKQRQFVQPISNRRKMRCCSIIIAIILFVTASLEAVGIEKGVWTLLTVGDILPVFSDLVGIAATVCSLRVLYVGDSGTHIGGNGMSASTKLTITLNEARVAVAIECICNLEFVS